MTSASSRSMRSVVVAIAGMAGSSFVLWLVGFPKLLAITFVLLWALYVSLDRLLGRLAGWAIGRTPKAFQWSIECVCVRPSLSWRPHAWSEIIILNWTWHNPPGFSASEEGVNEEGAPRYILQIDRLTLRLELASIYRALRHHEAVQVDMLLLEGARLRLQRNSEANLNLWEALDLPDSDVNVSAIVQNARRHGGMQFDMSNKRNMTQVTPLPPVSTEATRKAAKYTRPEWMKKRTMMKLGTPSSATAGRCFPCLPLREASSSSSSKSTTPTQAYFEYPIGDPRRRPRWGVPMRFDIRQMAVVHVELWIFDLLTLDHRWRLLTPGDTKMAVSSLFISRESLEAGDERRSGMGPIGDKIRGVYLGELIWVLIAQLLPKVIQKSPSNVFKAATFACGFGIRDSAVTTTAKVLDFVLDAKHFMRQQMSPASTREMASSPVDQSSSCRIIVHLIRGRGIAHEGQRVNVHARLELRNPPFRGPPVDTQYSVLRLWTKTPWWDQHFNLGPAESVSSVLRVALFFRRARFMDEDAASSNCHGRIGEVIIPLQTLLVRDTVIDGEMVGWFPLAAMANKGGDGGGDVAAALPRAEDRGSSPRVSRFRAARGRLKLGLKLTGRHHLPDLEAQ
mmetsp:Transcript_77601/g.179949  ORF Transcript_77601/g.179949 Transcript_77601/m.179949 type:complete len:622 (-) Transcript_77601:192-2057(-)